MKRSKTRKLDKSYDDVVSIYKPVPQEQRDEQMRRFLEAGGIIYKSKRGRQANGMTKAEITEHNKKVLEKLKQQAQQGTQTDEK